MKRLLNFLALPLLAVVLTACGARSVQSTDFKLPTQVEITFQVLLPESSAGQPIYLTLLDTLTGDLINPQHILMDSDGERSYSATISAPIGSLLHYRYTLGEAHASEASLAGLNFGARIYYVAGPTNVLTDVVAGWAGDSIEFVDGAVHGQILSAEDGSALSNMLINISGLEARSNQDGEFIIRGLQQGLHNIVALSPSGDYLPFQQGALVAADSETPAIFEMQPLERINVNFVVNLPEDHVPGVPLFLVTNVAGVERSLPASYNADGQAFFSLELPILQDIRYKYSLGDGFWNAEHLATGQYLTRQIILDEDMNALVIEDTIATWQAGHSAPIWFEASLPAPGETAAYIQFRFADWTPAIAMWSIGESTFAYKLNSPTNFAAPLQYRYCQDAFCLHSEAIEAIRTISGNLEVIQYTEDEIVDWN